MDFKKMFGKGVLGFLTGLAALAAGFLSSNPSAIGKVLPENLGNMTIGAALSAGIVMAANWLKNKNK